MSENTLSVRLKHAAKTEAEWKASNPVLLKGEIAYSTDKRQQKTGDGASKWTELDYDSAVPTSHSHDLSAMINKLATAAATPTDEDYYVSQYVGGGTTNTSYYRRPMSALWSYIKGKLKTVATTGSYNDLSNKPGTGTASAAGLTKLYTSTGTASDGSMTQAAIKTALDGKANSSHTHNYAGSSSAGGSANSAVKLSTARNISANDDYIMNYNFDGSGNISTQLRAYNATIAQGNKNNYPFHRFAKTDVITQDYRDIVTTFLITQDYNGGGYGICRIVLRTNNQSKNKDLSNLSIEWLVRSGFAVDSIQAGLYTKDGKTYADVFFKSGGTYAGTVIRNLGSGSRGNIGRTWTLVNSIEKDNTTTSDKLASTEVYATIAAAGTELHKQAYTSTITGKDVGNTNYSNTAGSSTKATQDSAGQQINTTYLKGLSMSGKTVTYTKGNNSTGKLILPTASSSADGFMTADMYKQISTYLAGDIDLDGGRATSASSDYANDFNGGGA